MLKPELRIYFFGEWIEILYFCIAHLRIEGVSRPDCLDASLVLRFYKGVEILFFIFLVMLSFLNQMLFTKILIRF